MKITLVYFTGNTFKNLKFMPACPEAHIDLGRSQGKDNYMLTRWVTNSFITNVFSHFIFTS